MKAVERILNLNDDAIMELTRIDQYVFNIFTLRAATDENELVVTVAHIFAIEGVFDDLPINNEKFIPFMQKI